MRKALKDTRISVAVITALLLVFTTFGASPTFAAAPYVDEVNYLGKGKVEVDFDEDAQYKDVKITVKDTSGKKYTAKIYKKTDDELRFKVENYKNGKTYKFTISGVREEHTSKYGKVTGKFKVPKSSSKNISASKAKSIALKDAKLKESEVYDLDVEKEREGGKTFYEVTFEAKGHDYEYDISLKGKILFKDVERD